MSKVETLSNLTERCTDLIGVVNDIADYASGVERSANETYSKATESIDEMTKIKAELKTLTASIDGSEDDTDVKSVVFYKVFPGNGSNPIAFEYESGWKDFMKNVQKLQRQYVTVYRVSVKLTPYNLIAIFNEGACHYSISNPVKYTVYEDLMYEVDRHMQNLVSKEEQELESTK